MPGPAAFGRSRASRTRSRSCSGRSRSGWPRRSCCRSRRCCLVHAWAIPELYAARGARRRRRGRDRGHSGPEPVALGLLGDLVDHRARELLRPHPAHARARPTRRVARGGGGRAPHPAGRPAGPLLLRAGDRAPSLPPSDRTAHLLLALRTDEPGFTTVANLAFSERGGGCAGGWPGSARGARRRRAASPDLRQRRAAAPAAHRRARSLAPGPMCDGVGNADHARHDPFNSSLKGPARGRSPGGVLDRQAVPIRRYRLARLRLDRPPPAANPASITSSASTTDRGPGGS